MFRRIVGVSVAVLVVAVLVVWAVTGGEPDAELVPQGRSIFVNAADRPMIIVSHETRGINRCFNS